MKIFCESTARAILPALNFHFPCKALKTSRKYCYEINDVCYRFYIRHSRHVDRETVEPSENADIGGREAAGSQKRGNHWARRLSCAEKSDLRQLIAIRPVRRRLKT
jgi:hypothetical protein